MNYKDDEFDLIINASCVFEANRSFDFVITVNGLKIHFWMNNIII